MASIKAKMQAEPAALAVDVHRLAAMLLGNSPRPENDPYLHAAIQFQHEALKLRSYNWERPSSKIKVTYQTVLETVRLLFCWRALGSPAACSAAELVRSATRFCSESRDHHLSPFWTGLRAGEGSEALRRHLLGAGARGPFDRGPFAVDVFPYEAFEPERLLEQPRGAPVPLEEMAPELEDLLVDLAVVEP
jgi:hypothetical protein